MVETDRLEVYEDDGWFTVVIDDEYVFSMNKRLSNLQHGVSQFIGELSAPTIDWDLPDEENKVDFNKVPQDVKEEIKYRMGC